MALYEVGQPYPAGSPPYPEGGEYNYRGGAHELRLFFNTPTPAEGEAVRTGPAEVALTVDGPVVFLLYRFGEAFHWSDAPYTIHMVPADQRTPPPALEAGQGVLLTVLLIDAGSGIVRAIRVVSLSPHLTRELHAAIARQLADPFDQAAYDRHLQLVYQRSDTRALLRQARARTRGGQ